jgi:hypothetical protein
MSVDEIAVLFESLVQIRDYNRADAIIDTDFHVARIIVLPNYRSISRFRKHIRFGEDSPAA